MVTILRDVYGKIVAVYVDDLIVYGHDWRSCWGNTLTVLRTITKAGLAINVGKAFLCRTRAKVLGHVIDGMEGVMTPNPSTLKPLLNFEPPKTLVQLQSLFGQLNFFRVLPTLRVTCQTYQSAATPVVQPRVDSVTHCVHQTGCLRAIGFR